MSDLADLAATHIHDHSRQAAARLRAAAAIVATRGVDPLADWLDDLAAKVAPPRTDTEEPLP